MNNRASGLRKTSYVVGFVVLGLIWLVCLGFGWHVTMAYDSTPGKPSSGNVAIGKVKETPYRCVLVAHPLCPCTRASLKALQEVETKFPGRFQWMVVFVGKLDGESENLALARKLPRVVVTTMSAKEARRRYDAHTSGQAFIFDGDGSPLFSGGLTAQRGLEDARFTIAIFEEVQRKDRRMEPYPVYGCALGD